MSEMPKPSPEEMGIEKEKRPGTDSFSIEKDSQRLDYFAANHSFDPQNEQFQLIRDRWQEFLSKTEGRDRIVLVEGGKRPLAESEEEAIKRNGEAGFATYLAGQEGIETYCPEPDPQSEFEEISQSFSREELAYYYFARAVAQWHRVESKAGIEEYLGGMRSFGALKSAWGDFDFSLDNFRGIHDKFHDHRFDLENRRCFSDDSNPNKSAVVRAVSAFRDRHIVGEIESLWGEGKSLFVVYGGDHAEAQEPELREHLT